MPRSQRTLGSSVRVAAMLAALAPVLAAAKTAAEEGKEVVLSMLVVGLVFVGVVVLGDVWHWRARKRHARRATRGY
jgi:ABC-type sugar transport system substrate-binding protein